MTTRVNKTSTRNTQAAEASKPDTPAKVETTGNQPENTAESQTDEPTIPAIEGEGSEEQNAEGNPGNPDHPIAEDLVDDEDEDEEEEDTNKEEAIGNPLQPTDPNYPIVEAFVTMYKKVEAEAMAKGYATLRDKRQELREIEDRRMALKNEIDKISPELNTAETLMNNYRASIRQYSTAITLMPSQGLVMGKKSGRPAGSGSKEGTPIDRALKICAVMPDVFTFEDFFTATGKARESFGSWAHRMINTTKVLKRVDEGRYQVLPEHQDRLAELRKEASAPATV